MGIRDRLFIERPTDDTDLTRWFYLFVLIPTVLGAAHHIDHIVRGNHVGWPITHSVNEFTFSLVIYPILVISLALSLANRVGARYWVGVFAFTAGMLVYSHLGPWAVEPPQDVMVPHSSALVGYLAFGILLALIGSIVVGAAYGATLWYQNHE